MRKITKILILAVVCMLVIASFAYALAESYTIKLNASEQIYKGPGMDYGCAKLVGENGVYTIVEEAICWEGYLWGKLKSGAGWVRLTDVPMEADILPAESARKVRLAAWVPIFDAPREEGGAIIDIVGLDGVYTIVQEKTDAFGDFWGRLKSGAGWVNLSHAEESGNPPITAYFAEVIDEIPDHWCDFVVDNSEYMTRVAIRVNEYITDFSFHMLTYGDGFETLEEYCSLDWLGEDTYFTAGIVFYGDMTTYGISFADSNGVERRFALSLSGYDGSIELYEYFSLDW